MSFNIATQTGVYAFSEDSITRNFFGKLETSPGLLVKKHYEDIERALLCAYIIREGKCLESVTAYWHKEEDLKDCYLLERVVSALEDQLDLFCEGAYRQVVAAQEHHDPDPREIHRYWLEIQKIWAEIDTLQGKRYYENELHHHPGIPRIETVGKRLVDRIIDLVWRMDNDAPSMHEELVDALHRVDEKNNIYH